MKLPTLVDAVEFRRDQYGLTQRDWAYVLGMRPSHYSEFVNGKRGITLKQAAKAFEYGVPSVSLFQTKGGKHIQHIKKLLKQRDSAKGKS